MHRNNNTSLRGVRGEDKSKRKNEPVAAKKLLNPNMSSRIKSNLVHSWPLFFSFPRIILHWESRYVQFDLPFQALPQTIAPSFSLAISKKTFLEPRASLRAVKPHRSSDLLSLSDRILTSSSIFCRAMGRRALIRMSVSIKTSSAALGWISVNVGRFTRRRDLSASQAGLSKSLRENETALLKCLINLVSGLLTVLVWQMRRTAKPVPSNFTESARTKVGRVNKLINQHAIGRIAWEAARGGAGGRERGKTQTQRKED